MAKQQSPIVPILVNVLGAGIPALMDHFAPDKVAARKAERLRRKGQPVPATLQGTEATPPPVANTVGTLIGAAQVAIGGAVASGVLDASAIAPDAPDWVHIASLALTAAGSFLIAVSRFYSIKKNG